MFYISPYYPCETTITYSTINNNNNIDHNIINDDESNDINSTPKDKLIIITTVENELLRNNNNNNISPRSRLTTSTSDKLVDIDLDTDISEDNNNDTKFDEIDKKNKNNKITFINELKIVLKKPLFLCLTFGFAAQTAMLIGIIIIIIIII